MAVLGFLVTRRMCRSAGLDPEVIANAALYCLVIGMIGARTFFVVHYFDQFRGDLAGVFAVWRGGPGVSRRGDSRDRHWRFWRPGLTVALAFILYGVTRPVLESIRDDNPFEFASLTVSQTAGIFLFVVGLLLLAAHVFAKPHRVGAEATMEVPETRNMTRTPKANLADSD